MAIGLSGALGRNKTRISRVPATLGRDDLKPLADQALEATRQYGASEAGLGTREKGAMRTEAFDTLSQVGKTQRMRESSYLQRRGVRGQAMQRAMERTRQSELESKRNALIQIQLAEHAIREGDISRRLAAMSGFLWPAEAARGAGEVSSTTTSSSKLGLNYGYNPPT